MVAYASALGTTTAAAVRPAMISSRRVPPPASAGASGSTFIWLPHGSRAAVRKCWSEDKGKCAAIGRLLHSWPRRPFPLYIVAALPEHARYSGGGFGQNPGFPRVV